MFELHLFDDRYKVDTVAIRCINYKKINRFIFRKIHIRINDL